MSLAPYAKRLTAAVASKRASAFEKLCFDLESDQLGKDNWPQEVFDFFIEALHDPEICALNGSMSFVTTLYSDFDKLTPDHQATLLRVVDENVDEFGDEMLRHSASDLIARKYPPQVAVKKFIEWMRQGTPRRAHMAQVGFEVLVMARKLEAPDETKVRGYLHKLWQRKD